MVSQDRLLVTISSICTLKCRTCQEQAVLQDRWSLMAGILRQHSLYYYKSVTKIHTFTTESKTATFGAATSWLLSSF